MLVFSLLSASLVVSAPAWFSPSFPFAVTAHEAAAVVGATTLGVAASVGLGVAATNYQRENIGYDGIYRPVAPQPF